MHTDQMNYFLTTVSCLNMTEAAAALHVTQSALSRSISAMEAELGVKLFIRDKGKALRLTAEGAEVYRHLSRIYASYTGMIEAVEDVKKGFSGKIVVGFLEGQMLDGQLQQLFDAFGKAYPRIKLTFTRDTEEGLRRQLLKRELDVAVMLALQVQLVEGLLYTTLFWLPTYMIASKNHPLAQRESVSLKELKDDTFVYIKDSLVTEEMMRHCRALGFEPKIRYVKNMREQSLALELGQGIAGYNEYHACFYSPNVATFRVEEIPDAGFVMAWNKNNYNPAIALLEKHAAGTAGA